MKKTSLFIMLAAAAFSSCKKEPEAETTPTTTASDLNTEILTSFSANVSLATYSDLADKATQLYTSVQALVTSTNDANLTNCKQLWKDCRASWEQSEGFLFGPVESNNIDPHIDTWPVNYTDLDSVLNGTATFDEAYINSLEDALRGFHPIEYLLFGTDGNKTASQFTERQKQYLEALTLNIKTLTSQLAESWDPSVSGNYYVQVTGAGGGNSVYTTKRAIFEEMVNAMIGICDEVANAKIEEPFAAQDPGLEESPFASNSITDFTNNIKSVQNVYLGKYTADGYGLEDLVRKNNLSLDGSVKAKINGAITALNNITVPFGQAITSQHVQVTNAQSAINELKDVLENDLMPYVQAQTN